MDICIVAACRERELSSSSANGQDDDGSGTDEEGGDGDKISETLPWRSCCGYRWALPLTQ